MARINWEKEFDRSDAENTKLLRMVRNEQLRKLALELTLEISDEKLLRNIVTFMASLQGKRLSDGTDGYSLIAKEGAANV